MKGYKLKAEKITQKAEQSRVAKSGRILENETDIIPRGLPYFSIKYLCISTISQVNRMTGRGREGGEVARGPRRCIFSPLSCNKSARGELVSR